MRQIKIAFIAILLCLCLTISSAQSSGYHSECCNPGAAYWALPLIFFGIPALAYALSGGYNRETVYVQPSYVYSEPAPTSYQRTYYRTRSIEQPAVPSTPTLQRTVDEPARYRYYCRSPRGYYPDVMDCPLGWKKATPTYTPVDQKADK